MGIQDPTDQIIAWRPPQQKQVKFTVNTYLDEHRTPGTYRDRRSGGESNAANDGARHAPADDPLAIALTPAWTAVPDKAFHTFFLTHNISDRLYDSVGRFA